MSTVNTVADDVQHALDELRKADVEELRNKWQKIKSRILDLHQEADLLIENGKKWKPGDKVTTIGVSKNHGIIVDSSWEGQFYSYRVLLLDKEFGRLHDYPQLFPEERLMGNWV